MSQALLDRLLAGTLSDPDGPGTLSVPTRSAVIGRQLGKAAAQLIAPLALGRRLMVVTDPTTKSVMGDRVTAALSAGYKVTEFVFDGSPHPDMQAVERLKEAARSADGMVAVGSGSINDIVKYAAHLLERPYCVFGTAPSMNGYTSLSAAITEHGHKKSLSSTAARGVFLDLDILAAAPTRLIAAGFGDSMSRSTAQADWLLAHHLLGTPYRKAPFLLLRDDEDVLVREAPKLLDGDIGQINVLARTLVMSGFGMTICGGSYPASQSEHLIAHYLDMFGKDLPPRYHGEHIAVTTLTIARLQERILARPTLSLSACRDTLTGFVTEFGGALGESCWQAFQPKCLDEARAASLDAKLMRRWPELRVAVRSNMRPAAEIETALKQVGAPTTPIEVGTPIPFYAKAVYNARKIRDRFGILDIAQAAGILDTFIADEIAAVAA